MLIVDKLKGNLYTRIKKHMTKKMYHLYYRENREASQSKEEYEANLLRARILRKANLQKKRKKFFIM